MIIHEFINSQKIELDSQSEHLFVYEKFYNDTNDLLIVYSNYDEKVGKLYQQNDTDVLVFSEEVLIDKISEKTRTKGFNDILFELISVFKENKICSYGWAYKDVMEQYAPNKLSYSLPNKSYLINNLNMIKKDLKDKINLNDNLIYEFIKNIKENESKFSFFTKINNKSYIFAKNIDVYNKNETYYTISTVLKKEDIEKIIGKENIVEFKKEK